MAQSEQDRATARELAQRADQEVAAGRIEEALVLFRKAESLVPAPSLTLMIARLLVKQGKLVEAHELMLAVARSSPVPSEPAPWARAREDAQTEAATLAPRLCALEIHVQGLPKDASPTISLDGTPFPVAALGAPWVLDPGPHSVVIEVSGFEPETRQVELKEGERKKLAIRLKPLAREKGTIEKDPSETKVPPPPPPSHPPVPSAQKTRANPGLLWGGIATAGIFSATGAVTGWITLQRADELREKCPYGQCSRALGNEIDQAKTMATLSTVSFALAGVGLALSVTGLLLREDVPSEPQATLHLHLGPGSIGLGGQF